MNGEIQFRFRLPHQGFRLDAEATIPGHGLTGLFGRSGSGKTTLLRCLAGLEQAPEAYLSVGGECWHDSKKGIFLPPHQRAVGYVFQEGLLFPHLRVKENLAYGIGRSSGRTQGNALDHVVEVLELAPLLNRHPGQLSGGEKQRVAIGRALLHSPRMLLMDEPMAALDRQRKSEILPYLERLHREAEIPVIYVTHDAEELVRIADHLMLIDEGRLIARGPLAEVLSRMDLPIVRDTDAGAVLKTTILGHDEEFHLTRLGFAGGELTVGWIDRPTGSAIRIRIHAKDISLTLEPPGLTSILNILPAEIKEMAVHGRGRVMVRMEVAGYPLLARITRKSQSRLGLKEGMKVYAQIKSVALTL
jgi:molybdate transport system ATP-binding protein